MPAALLSGVPWQVHRVSSMELFVLDGGAHRARLLFEREDQPIGRDRAALEYNVQQFEEIESSVYLGTYLARVVAQSADLATVDVEIEPDVPPDKRKIDGLVRVPLYGSVPGMVLDVSPGPTSPDRFCMVTFLNADRGNPCIVGWRGASSNNALPATAKTRIRGDVIELGQGGPRKVARNDDPTVNGSFTIEGIPAMGSTSPKLRFSYSPPGGTLQSINVDLPPTSPSNASLTLSGLISDGSPIVKTD